MFQYLNGMDITVFGDGEQTRAFSYIDDSLKPLWNAAIKPEASKEIINLGGIEEISINKAAETLIEVLQKEEGIDDFKIPIKYLEARHEVKHSIPTHQKSIDILGFEHKTDLKKGLTEMWKWAKQQPMRERFVWPNYELEKGIYSFWKNK
jgi:UDP-glucose 4-epimerase